MGNWQPWTYPGHWNIEEHNAVLAALRKAEAEVERMGRANNEACDRIVELEAQLAAVPRVDPEAWKTPLELQYAERQSVVLEGRDGGFYVTIDSNGKHVGNVSFLLPADAARASVWLASYAQAHGAPVDLGQQPEPAPADATTLEALARIGQSALFPTRHGHMEYDDLRPDQKENWNAATAAILRAARPRVEVDIREIEKIAWEGLIPDRAVDILALCNSRIRIGVELPESLQNLQQLPAEPTDAQIEALVRVLKKAYDESNSFHAGYRSEARAAYAHIGAELAAALAVINVPPGVPPVRLPDREALANTIYKTYDATQTIWGMGLAQADAALAMFRELNAMEVEA